MLINVLHTSRKAWSPTVLTAMALNSSEGSTPVKASSNIGSVAWVSDTSFFKLNADGDRS